jgi:hypothetical protein
MKKTLLIVALLIEQFAFSQSLEERAVIKQDINFSELNNLKNKFDKDYLAQQEKINVYLLANPSAKRTFLKDGNAYLLHHIDTTGMPIYINTKDFNQQNNSKANSLYTGGSMGVNIIGTGMVTGVWDGGQINANHELLAGKVTMQPGQTVNSSGGNNHMTAVSGIMVGKKLASSPDPNGTTATGIAYGATTQNYDWDNDIAEMTTFAGNGYLISNHSYGYANDNSIPVWQFGAYDSTAKAWDALLKTTPNYLPFVAVGNEQQSNGNSSANGFDIITGSSASKNVMTVGAINLDNTMSSYSNWGPTDDGRVKPDIVTLGTAINVPLYNNNTGYTGVDVSSSGTSYAAPAAAAAGLLLQQYYHSIFNSYMTAASLKALMLHTANDAGNPGPDAKFGWGILNVERAAQTIFQMQNGGSAKLKEFTTNPTNNSSSEVNLSGLKSGGGALKASIAWTDDDGTEQTYANGVNNTTSRLVYNFDILFRSYSPFTNVWPYQPLSVTNPNANATVSTTWFQNNVDNYKQANISTSNSNSDVIVYVRKSTSSPATVRNFSILVTGLNIMNPTLGVENVGAVNETIFYSKEESKIKIISNNANVNFGEYKIYDMTGKLLQSGNEKSNEIFFKNNVTGVYILNYQNKSKINSFKFKL